MLKGWVFTIIFDHDTLLCSSIALAGLAWIVGIINPKPLMRKVKTSRRHLLPVKRAMAHLCSTAEKPGPMSMLSHFADWEEAGYDLRGPDAGLEPLLEPLRRGLPRQHRRPPRPGDQPRGHDSWSVIITQPNPIRKTKLPLIIIIEEPRYWQL